jgi:hypothetical protein
MTQELEANHCWCAKILLRYPSIMDICDRSAMADLLAQYNANTR